MAMQMSAGEAEVIIDINTTPLIDVMLVLIIMLIITIPIQTHAVKLNMPVGTPPPPTAPPEIVRLDVDFDGTLSWNGEQVTRDAMELRFRSSAAQPVQPEFHLRPERLVTYEHVAYVMASAQRAGTTRIGLVGAERFLGED
jgi:biopolymer transport protein ExbD